MEVDAPGPAVVIVDRHPDVSGQRVRPERRNQREPREQPLRDAPVVRIRLAVAAAVERHAVVGLLDVEDDVAVGLDVLVGLGPLVHRVVVDFEAVHVGDVAGVDPAFHRLEVVAFLQPLRDEYMARWQRAPLDAGRRRLLVLRPHVGPDDAAALDARVGRDAHVLAGLRRRRHLHALAAAVELQPVVRTADAVLFIAAEIERHAAMRAELADQAGLAGGVAKGQQLFSKDLHAHLRPVRLGDFAREEDRHPIAAHQVAHRRTGAGTGEGLGHFGIHVGISFGGMVECPSDET